jgi:hypothetical protein
VAVESYLDGVVAAVVEGEQVMLNVAGIEDDVDVAVCTSEALHASVPTVEPPCGVNWLLRC